MMNTKAYVYGLIDPRYNILRYIGVTKNSLNNRLNDHVRDSKKPNFGNKHKNYWIQELLNEELTPDIIILEECENHDDAFEAEIWWIDFIGLNNLTNIALGGDRPPSWKGRKHTEEAKKKQSDSIKAYYAKNNPPRKGKKAPRNEVEKARKTKIKNNTLHQSNKDVMSPEAFREIYIKRDTPEWRKKLSDKQKKRLAKPENNPMYGKKQSDESKMKNRLSNLMYHANRKKNLGALFDLQKLYYEIAGHYQEKYPVPY